MDPVVIGASDRLGRDDTTLPPIHAPPWNVDQDSDHGAARCRTVLDDDHGDRSK